MKKMLLTTPSLAEPHYSQSMYYNRHKGRIDSIWIKCPLDIVCYVLRASLYHLLFAVVLHLSRLLLSMYIFLPNRRFVEMLIIILIGERRRGLM